VHTWARPDVLEAYAAELMRRVGVAK
jgi:hypothetical protein